MPWIRPPALHALLTSLPIAVLVSASLFPMDRGAKLRAAPDVNPEVVRLLAGLSDPNLREGASLALSRFSDEAVVPLKMSLTTGPADARVWSAYTLGRIGESAAPARTALIGALQSRDVALRAAAAQALGRIGADASATDVLVAALRDANPEVQRQAITALSQFAADGTPEIGRTIAKPLIKSLDNVHLRAQARMALLQVGRHAAPDLLDALGDARLRFDVANLLRQIDPQSAKRAGVDVASSADLACLKLVLEDPTRDLRQRRSAARSLAGLGPPGASVLVDAISEKENAPPAILAMGSADSSAVPLLVARSRHKSAAVRGAVAAALGQLGPRAKLVTTSLTQLLADPDQTVRYQAVRALHGLGTEAKPAVDKLSQIIHDPREQEATRQWAIKTLVVTLPATHDKVVQTLTKAAGNQRNYGVKQLARQMLLEIDAAAAKKAGIK